MNSSPKRIVLSRKGFDGIAGGVPSPIFPDGRMLSLPIPATSMMGESSTLHPECPEDHRDIQWNNWAVSEIVNSLRKNKKPIQGVHLDPDLDRAIKVRGKDRPSEWRGLFGQSGGPQNPLRELQPGDLFLFFGLFSKVKVIAENPLKLEYLSKKPSARLNVLFGWLQIETIRKIDSLTDAQRFRAEHPWAASHPHLQDSFRGKNNVLYVGKEKLVAEGASADIPGYGVFKHFSEPLQLSEKGNSGSFWLMPTWFKPKGRTRSVWCSHANGTTCWTPLYDDEKGQPVCHRVHLGPGQEFVLDCNDYPESVDWAIEKIRSGLGVKGFGTSGSQ